MSFRQYETYGDSGVEWLGEVPKHWPIVPLLSVATEREETNIGMKETNLLSLSYGRIIRKDINANDGLLPESFETYQVVRPGDVVWRLTDLQNDKRSLRTAIVNEVGIITSAYLTTTPVNISPQYFNYLLRAYDTMKVFYSMGGGLRQAMKFSDVKRLPVLKPPALEQGAIISFLDRETFKIDALVEEQKHLIELLKEKRQGIISHAVTKGLDPNAPMKNSDAEPVGEVPEHWEVRRLKRISPEITVGIVIEPSKYYRDEGIPALRSLNVRPGQVTLENVVHISEEANELLSKSKLRKGDLVAVRSGQPGTTAVVPQELDGCNCVDLIIIRKPIYGSEWFLCWYLASEAAARQFTEGSGGAIQQHFNISTAANLLIAWPPVEEQRDIVAVLSRETARIDALLAEADAAIALLHERRSALIYAAVTGDIDVRNLVAS
jgi:type I restriction enzyme S subunit